MLVSLSGADQNAYLASLSRQRGPAVMGYTIRMITEMNDVEWLQLP
jgi:hypothetical protein